MERDGDGPDARYKNTPSTAAFLNKTSATCIGRIPEMFNARLFSAWNNLGEALKTAQPQNEAKYDGVPFFEEVYADQVKLGQFLEAMSGLQAANFQCLADTFGLRTATASFVSTNAEQAVRPASLGGMPWRTT